MAAEQAEAIAAAAVAIHERLQSGGMILAFGNGGSATDANDFVLDCVAPPAGLAPIPAISLSMEPANISAIANNVGVELVFMRQMIAVGRPQDIALAISTSGKSKNVVAALDRSAQTGNADGRAIGFARGRHPPRSAGRPCVCRAVGLYSAIAGSAGGHLSRIESWRWDDWSVEKWTGSEQVEVCTEFAYVSMPVPFYAAHTSFGFEGVQAHFSAEHSLQSQPHAGRKMSQTRA